MRKSLLTIFLITGIFGFISLFITNAQTDLKGRYIHAGKDGEISYDFTLNFQSKGVVFYSYAHNGYGTLKGTWSLEKELITVIVPKKDSTLTFKFKREGDNLVITEALPPMEPVIVAGTVFKKQIRQPTGPALTSENISNRILKLIKSIRTSQDISPENIERQMKIKPVFYDKERTKYGFAGDVTGAPDWTYGVSVYLHPILKNPYLVFSFDYQVPGVISPEMTSVCSPDFDAFSKELTKAGFSSPAPVRGEHNRIIYWQSSLNKTSVNISATGEKKEGIRRCINLLEIQISR